MEGILFRMRTRIPWRELPAEYGKWHTVFKSFNSWSDFLFNELAKDHRMVVFSEPC